MAVMKDGEIRQIGKPWEIYRRPRSEFVARFIGSSNVVTGKALDDSRIALAGVALRGNGGDLRRRRATAPCRSASTTSA